MADDSRLARTARSVGSQRVNVGLTLLAVVFLTVMAAAAGVRASKPARPVNPKSETLAVLGVAPSSGVAATMTADRPAAAVAVPQSPPSTH